MYGCQMSPQVKKPVSARCYLPQKLLGGEASKKLVRAVNLGVPCFYSESYQRTFFPMCPSPVNHSVSFVLRKSLSEHGRATLRFLLCGLVLNHIPMFDE